MNTREWDIDYRRDVQSSHNPLVLGSNPSGPSLFSEDRFEAYSPWRGKGPQAKIHLWTPHSQSLSASRTDDTRNYDLWLSSDNYELRWV